MSYWIFNGSPWNKKGYTNLADVRKAAVKKLIHNKREYVQIVKADEPPYDWKRNYTVIGMVVLIPGWKNPTPQWYPHSWYITKKEPKWITPSGNLGSVIPRNERSWNP